VPIARPLAHSANAEGAVHDLEEHLIDVAATAAGFATVFGSANYARAAGLWHDLGKNAPDFQARIEPDAHVETGPGRLDHSSAGAVYAVDQLGRGTGLPVAFTIAGHHGGLPDLEGLNQRLVDPAKWERLQLALTASGAPPLALHQHGRSSFSLGPARRKRKRTTTDGATSSGSGCSSRA
jgi:CRISPR-associated endonuclease Cas3-HD